MKVVALIDGFNVYHAIREQFPSEENFRWLDLRSLAQSYVSKTDTLEVHYFTAYCSWHQAKKDRHKVYVNALMARGVKVKLGQFKRVERSFFKQFMTVNGEKHDP